MAIHFGARYNYNFNIFRHWSLPFGVSPLLLGQRKIILKSGLIKMLIQVDNVKNNSYKPLNNVKTLFYYLFIGTHKNTIFHHHLLKTTHTNSKFDHILVPQ